jgi:hypothetical protein
VHLRHRRRGQRLPLDRRERLVDRAPEVGGERSRDRVPGHRRGPVLQRGQLLDELGGQQVAPGGQLLAELDERHAALVEGRAQRPGQLPPRRGGRGPGLRPAAQEPAEAVPQRDPDDRPVAAGPGHPPDRAAPQLHRAGQRAGGQQHLEDHQRGHGQQGGDDHRGHEQQERGAAVD